MGGVLLPCDRTQQHSGPQAVHRAGTLRAWPRLSRGFRSAWIRCQPMPADVSFWCLGRDRDRVFRMPNPALKGQGAILKRGLRAWKWETSTDRGCVRDFEARVSPCWRGCVKALRVHSPKALLVPEQAATTASPVQDRICRLVEKYSTRTHASGVSSGSEQPPLRTPAAQSPPPSAGRCASDNVGRLPLGGGLQIKGRRCALETQGRTCRAGNPISPGPFASATWKGRPRPWQTST
jgi:hypothetical protein